MAKPASIKVPITNVFGGGDYTVQLSIGSEKVPANLIVDTGSSTLAVQQTRYRAAKDKSLNPTAWAQDITYGTGGWAGPVVMTDVTIGSGAKALTLKNAPMAIAAEQEPNNFGQADGILGLAYTPLNDGSNLHSYLAKQGVKPPVTYPWPFPISNTTAAVVQFEKFLQSMPTQSITPYFTLLEQEGITPNKFAMYTLRSWPSARQANPAKDKLNLGWLVLGGGEEYTGLYDGDFLDVDVLDDLYYNTNLTSVQVEGAPRVPVKPLPQQLQPDMGSNSIVDSGTNALFLATDVYNAVMGSLQKLDKSFVKAIEEANQSDTGIAASQLKLAKWPDIGFTLAGAGGGDVALACSPETYWQTDTPSPGRAVFQIVPGGRMPQSILGLPLMNNYYTVFDRSVGPRGVIRFAPIKA
jgi:aspartyl protease